MDDLCKMLKDDIKKRKKLGKGKQSVVYDFGKTVMRVSNRMINYEILHRASKAGIHPHIYGIYECGELTYIQMDKLTESFIAVKHGKQMASLVTRMVKAGILHNDIHAENLMAKDGKLFLIDFENSTLIDGITKEMFDKEFKYHSHYSDETYSKQFQIEFTSAQKKTINDVRKKISK